ncbi:MAG: transporter substrate-binding domain-containing protein [Pseudomonadales bacterium]|nr:transporter substrate-binding domain-containing protein [Pseudomonadales bacterium]NRA14545.1 transporter substrate-binding domain-containing protein [Oceanospirillaceae bacterium]
MEFFAKTVVLLFITTICSANTLTISHIATAHTSNDLRETYYVELLELALSKTIPDQAYQQFRLLPFKRISYRKRAFEMLRSGELDVLWAMASIERENKALPIRIPLLKGLLGYRIFIIRQGEQQRFSVINSLEQLRRLTAGQGPHWSDTKILQANGLEVVTAESYISLFSLLQHKRFDYFPRGVHEPWHEIITNKDKNLVVEKKLLLRYPSPLFFFVSNNNTALQQRIKSGLQIAIADGSFDRLLYNHPITQEIFSAANISQRLIFDLANPQLSPETKALLEDQSLWYSIGD